MEEQKFERKIKPIFLKNLTIRTQFSYENFMRKRFKGQSKVELRKVDHQVRSTENTRNAANLWTSKFLKVSKNLKYAKKLDLSGLVLCFTKYYLPKMLYFAKKMSNSRIVKMNDFKTPELRYQGTFERFIRYIKKAQSFHYDYTARRDRNSIVGQVKHNHDFVHLLRYQPHLTP